MGRRGRGKLPGRGRGTGATEKERAVFSDGGRSARSLAIILIVHLAVIVLWEVLVDAFHVPKFILPSPLATLATLAHAKYAWISNLAVTAVGILPGVSPCAPVPLSLSVMFFL